MPTSTETNPSSGDSALEGIPKAGSPGFAEQMATDSPSTALGQRLPYLKINLRFWIAILFGLLWVGFSAWVALPWIRSLGESITLPVAIFVIGGIALLPGYLNAFLIASLVLDRPWSLVPQKSDESRTEWPDVTLLISTFDEASGIAETLHYALESDYPGNLSILVADDGSSDRTREEVGRVAGEIEGDGRRIKLLAFPHRGKAQTLNRALARVDSEYLATIDADTLLSPAALRRVIGRLLNSTDETAAVAGAVMARNSRKNWLTRLQEWDYQLGIAAIKRSQAIWQATLVAQGSFSVFRTARVKEVGGWPDTIAEDIVMTWALMARGYSTSFEATALAFTEVPEHFRQLARQRSRWARGMIEALKAYGWKIIRQHHKSAHGIFIDLLFPWMDFCYTFAFLPGIVLALTGNFAIVGPLTLAVLPLNLLLFLLMFRIQRRSFGVSEHVVRRNRRGFISYVLTFQPIMSPLAVVGYLEELFRTPRRW